MKKKQPNSNLVTRMDGARDLAKKIVDMFYLDSTDLAARFSVVSFSETATLRETWSTDRDVLGAAIDSISPDGKTSISAGLTLAGQLLDNARDNATKIVLLLTDGKQTVKSDGTVCSDEEQTVCTDTAIAAAEALRGKVFSDGTTVEDNVFAWGFGEEVGWVDPSGERVGGREALARLAGDDSMVQFTDNISQLFDFLAELHAKVCN